MKYVTDMQMCTIEEDEGLNNLDTPANIKTECDYRTEKGFCVYCMSCDFQDPLKQNDVDMLNGK